MSYKANRMSRFGHMHGPLSDIKAHDPSKGLRFDTSSLTNAGCQPVLGKHLPVLLFYFMRIQCGKTRVLC